MDEWRLAVWASGLSHDSCRSPAVKASWKPPFPKWQLPAKDETAEGSLADGAFGIVIHACPSSAQKNPLHSINVRASGVKTSDNSLPSIDFAACPSVCPEVWAIGRITSSASSTWRASRPFFPTRLRVVPPGLPARPGPASQKCRGCQSTAAWSTPAPGMPAERPGYAAAAASRRRPSHRREASDSRGRCPSRP